VVISGCGTIGLGVLATIETFHPNVSVIILDYLQFKLDIAKSISNRCTTFNLSDQTVASVVSTIGSRDLQDE
jgi:threonine dehydrogenase-like Zn-dependent dehydrogenase